MRLAVFLICLVGTIVASVFSDKLFGENSVFHASPTNNAFVNALYQAVPAVIQSVQIVTVSILVTVLVRLIMHRALHQNNRRITIAKLVNNLTHWVVAVVTLLAVLSVWGVNTTTLLAGAGIFTLIVGLGAQSLVADIVAGMFIVFEGDYQVGDIVIIDGWRGTVQEIGIRTTKLMDAGGNVRIANNSSITSVINQTQQISLAACTVSIAYGEHLPRVEEVIARNLPLLAESIPAIVDGPFYKGVTALGASGVDLLFTANCREEDLYQVQRDLNRALKLLFDENKITIPLPQIVVNRPD